MIVLDTSILVDIERRAPRITEGLAQFQTERFTITSLVYAESLFGFLTGSQKQEGIEFLSGFEVIDFDRESAMCYAQTKQHLAKRGAPIPLLDLITASCALARNATFVTRDRHFQDIPGLKTVFL